MRYLYLSTFADFLIEAVTSLLFVAIEKKSRPMRDAATRGNGVGLTLLLSGRTRCDYSRV